MKKYFVCAALISALFVSVVLAHEENTSEDQNKSSDQGVKLPQTQKSEVKKLEKAVERLENFELPEVESTKEHPASLFVGPQGNVRILSSEITELGTATPSTDGIKVWGLTLRVDMGNAKFIPEGTTHTNLKVGDKVNIKGTMNANTGIISASTVHALSNRQRMSNDLSNQILALLVKIRELQQKAGLPLTPLPTQAQ